MATKQINISCGLLSTGGKPKTKRNKENPIAPIISPGVIRKTLLNRIKQRKQKENEYLASNTTKHGKNNNNDDSRPRLVDNAAVDEFKNSIGLLDSLAKQKTEMQQKQMLRNKTLKNYTDVSDSDNISTSPYVNLELPDNLKENPLISITTELQTQSQSQLQLQSHPQPSDFQLRLHNSPPYSNLKNGSKPLYRDWKQTTQKNMSGGRYAVVDEQPPKNDRENKLDMLKAKMKAREHERTMNHDASQLQMTLPQPQMLLPSTQMPLPSTQIPLPSTQVPLTQVPSPQMPTTPTQLTHHPRLQRPRRILKKTICKKTYTLGKSKTKNTVGVLIVGTKTRKQIIDAHKELKQTPIEDVKQYLRDHNFIKIGGTAPNDVLMRMYQDAKLTGDVNNVNESTLLNNFIRG